MSVSAASSKKIIKLLAAFIRKPKKRWLLAAYFNTFLAIPRKRIKGRFFFFFSLEKRAQMLFTVMEQCSLTGGLVGSAGGHPGVELQSDTRVHFAPFS